MQENYLNIQRLHLFQPLTKLICPGTISEKHRKNWWKNKPQDKDSTRLQKLSLMNNTHVGTNYYDIHLDIKLDYTISRLFQEMSLTELETLHQQI